MPKKVDHEERRRTLAEAVFAVIGDRGIEAVSVRDVARQADVSLGTVQHYFATKHEMLLFALGHLRDRIGQRVAAEMALLPKPATRRATVRHTLRATMPVDGPSRHEAVVTIAFFSHATVDPAYARLLHDSYTRILTVLRGWFAEAEAAGELRAGVDAAAEATALYVLTQGLVGPLLIGTFTPDEAVQLLDGTLDRIFAP